MKMASGLPEAPNCYLSRTRPGQESSVVWLRGEHDISTVMLVSTTIDEAIGLDKPTVVVDLSGARFVSAATIGILVQAKTELRRRSRALRLRAPSPAVERVLDVCGLSDLIDPGVLDEAPTPAKGAQALASWVEVPPTDRSDGRQGAPTLEREHAFAPIISLRP